MPMTLISTTPANRRQSVRSAESADSTRARVSSLTKDSTNLQYAAARGFSKPADCGPMGTRGEIHTLRPRSSAQELVDQFRTLIEEVRWQRADALILALQDHPLKNTLWAVIDEALGSIGANDTPGGK